MNSKNAHIHSRTGNPRDQGSRTGTPEEWRCRDCGKLLGVLRGGRLEMRWSRGDQCLVGFPVTATCRGCGAMNDCPGAERGRAPP